MRNIIPLTLISAIIPIIYPIISCWLIATNEIEPDLLKYFSIVDFVSIDLSPYYDYLKTNVNNNNQASLNYTYFFNGGLFCLVLFINGAYSDCRVPPSLNKRIFPSCSTAS